MIVSQFDEKAGLATLAIKGRFDYSSQKEFRECFAEYPKGAKFVVDLSQVSYIDSSALGMLLLLRDHAGANGKQIILKGASEFVANALRMARFERLFVLD